METGPRFVSMMDESQRNLSRMTRSRVPSFMHATMNSKSRDSSRERERRKHIKPIA